MTEIISSQLYFILLKDENRTKKSLQWCLFSGPCTSHIPHPNTSSDRRHWRADAPSPLACVSTITFCLIPTHYQESLCSSASRLKIISSSSYFVNFSSLEWSQLGEELCNLTVSWGNSPVKCIPIAHPSPWYISQLLQEESLPWESPQQERRTWRSLLKAHPGHCLSFLWCSCTQRAVGKSISRNTAISNSSNILDKWYQIKSNQLQISQQFSQLGLYLALSLSIAFPNMGEECLKTSPTQDMTWQHLGRNFAILWY